MDHIKPEITILKNVEYKVCEETVGSLKKEFFKAFTVNYKWE